MQPACVAGHCGRVVSIIFVIALAIIPLIIHITFMYITIIGANDGRRLVVIA